MLSNLKTSTKVVAGFGVLLTILAVLGVVNYVMFVRVDANVTGLTDSGLAVVKNGNGVERAAFESVSAMKSYFLYKKDEFAAKARTNLAEMAGSLDQIDKIAGRFNNADLAKKVQEAQRRGRPVRQAFRRRYCRRESRRRWHQADGRKGNRSASRGRCLFARKKAEHGREAQVGKTSQSVFLMFDLTQTTLAMRLAACTYIGTKDEQDWKCMTDNAARLSTLYGELRKLSATSVDRETLDRADKATQEYLAAAKSWAKGDTKLRTVILPELSKAGETVVDTIQADENGAWKASDDAASTVLGIVGTSKTIIIVAQILGVLVVVVLGYFISKSISKVLGALIGETKRLSTAAVEGKLQTRGNPESVSLEFRPIVENVNAAMDVFTGFIDHIPSPFMTMNKDREILYMNDCVATVIGLDKRQIEGTKCYEHFKTTHCNTPECACVRAMEQRCAVTAETTARPAGRELEISYVGLPIKDGGGKVVGVMEFVTDLTAVKRAAKVTAKVSDFQSQQSRTLTQNLEKLSAGDFNLALEVAEGDADTAAARESFLQIAGAVKQVVETLRGMTADAKKLRQAATEGKLDVRADEARYDGEYRQIIHGINETLAGFEKPIHEIAEVLTRLAAKDFTRTVGSQYPGLYGRLRDNVNQVVTNMRTAIEQITETAAQFGEGSRVVAEGSQTMAHGAQTQAPASRR